MFLQLITSDGAAVAAGSMYVMHDNPGVQTHNITLPLNGIRAGAYRMKAMYLDSTSALRTKFPLSATITIVIPFKVDLGEWQACSKSCGAGVQGRVVTCQVQRPDTAAYEAPHAMCEEAGLKLPSRTQPCLVRPCIVKPVPQWLCNGQSMCSTAWSACSRACGGGLRNRTVSCRQFDEQLNRFVNVSTTLCVERRPVQQEACNKQPCAVFSFSAGSWSECDVPCGVGFQYRSLQCQSQLTLASVPTHQCASEVPPDSIRKCSKPACPTHRWHFSAFSACDRSCGGGHAVRRQQCIRTDVGRGGGGGTTVVSDQNCQTLAVAAMLQSIPNACSTDEQYTCTKCNMHPCVRYSYLVDAFGTCSRTCGGGVQYRTVRCLATLAGSAESAPTSLMACAALGQPVPSAGACATTPCDPCANHECSGHGSCRVIASGDPQCMCDAGYTAASGMRCVAIVCPAGQTNGPNGACFHGVLLRNVAGGDLEMCNTTKAAQLVGHTAVVAADGKCCASGALDACGFCGGNAKVVDVLGTCCSSLPLDEDGICCTGVVDSCGVCNGNGATCSTRVQITVGAPTKESQLPVEAVLQPFTPQRLSYEVDLRAHFAALLSIGDASRITVTSVTVPTLERRRLGDSSISALVPEFVVVPPTAGLGGAATATAVGATQNQTAVITLRSVERALASSSAASAVESAFALSKAFVSAAGVCGNGVCESGERCSGLATGAQQCCPRDCPHVFKACPTPPGDVLPCGGHGECFASTGACNCHVKNGYTGADCSECLHGFTREVAATGAARCAMLLVAVPSGGILNAAGEPVVVTTVVQTAPTPAPTLAAETPEWPLLHSVFVFLGAGGCMVGAALLLGASLLLWRQRARRLRQLDAEQAQGGGKASPAAKEVANADATWAWAVRTPKGAARPPTPRAAKLAEFMEVPLAAMVPWHENRGSLANYHIERIVTQRRQTLFGTAPSPLAQRTPRTPRTPQGAPRTMAVASAIKHAEFEEVDVRMLNPLALQNIAVV
jgi:hypothetical protein